MADQKWQRDGRTVYLLNDAGVNQYDMGVQGGWNANDSARVTMDEAERMAESVLLALNAHAGLVAQHHNIIALAGGWDAQGATGPREPLSWETVARMAIDYARAALIYAYDLPADTTPDQLQQVQDGVLVWRGDHWEMPPNTEAK